MTERIATAIKQASRETWGAIVIGAGPAGALTARQLAAAGVKTLLLDAKRFPRQKVCGGCLNQRALAALRQAGLGQILDHCGGSAVDELAIISGRRSLRLPLPPGLAVSRATLDRLLVESAVEAGATFLPEILATVEPAVDAGCRTVLACHGARRERLAARVVVCADGLLRSSLKHLPEFASQIAPHSRLGAGALLDDATFDAVMFDTVYPAGRITMVVGRGGYVGLARVENNRLNVAAALDASGLLGGATLSESVASILRESKLPVPRGLEHAAWQGTPPLTSTASRAAAERLLVVGDAAGYVEPFTGEGIAWALEAALAAAPLAVRASADWKSSLAEEWETTCRRFGRNKQVVCRAMAWILRRPWSAAAAMTVCRAFPWAARRVIARVNQPPLLNPSPPSRGPLAVDVP